PLCFRQGRSKIAAARRPSQGATGKLERLFSTSAREANRAVRKQDGGKTADHTDVTDFSDLRLVNPHGGDATCFAQNARATLLIGTMTAQPKPRRDEISLALAGTSASRQQSKP